MKKIGLILLIFIGLQQTAFEQGSGHSTLEFISKEISRISIDSTYNYRFDAADSFHKPIAFAVENCPAWLQYDAIHHAISGKPVRPGQYMITIVASTTDTSIRQRFMLTVYDKYTKNILALGNSITNGTQKFNSYRRPLWQLLHNGNYNFDFIGSWNRHHGGGPVPDPDFDMDHEGHSGWTARNMVNPPEWDKQRKSISEWLKDYIPDIVLIELGTNEVFQCTTAKDVVNDISGLVDSLKERNQNVQIFLGLIPPLGAQWAGKKLCGNDTAYEKAIEIFNEALRSFGRANAKNISLVDQHSGINPAQNMYDDIHPNDSGEKIMAGRWFEAIKGSLRKISK